MSLQILDGATTGDCAAFGTRATLAQPAVSSNSRRVVYLTNQSRPRDIRTNIQSTSRLLNLPIASTKSSIEYGPEPRSIRVPNRTAASVGSDSVAVASGHLSCTPRIPRVCCATPWKRM